MRLKSKKVGVASIFFSIAFFYISTWFYAYALQLAQYRLVKYLFEVFVLSLAVGTIAIASCVVCVYLALRLLKKKISKETYFFVFLVLLFSVLGYVALRIILRIDFPNDLLVVASVILAAPISWVLAGYSDRTFYAKMRSMGLDNGVTIITLILLIAMPLVQVQLQGISTVSNRGQIYYEQPSVLFQNGNDTTKVQGQVNSTAFTAKVPIGPDSVFEATQVLNITNQSPNDLDLKIHLEDLNGNFSRVKQLEIFFAIGNVSKTPFLSFNNGNLNYEEIALTMESNATITMGVISFASNASSTNALVLSLLITWNEIEQTINAFVEV